jgi:hypothetical protein
MKKIVVLLSLGAIALASFPAKAEIGEVRVPLGAGEPVSIKDLFFGDADVTGGN